MRSTSGMNWLHSRCASPSHAARCSGVPCAAAELDISASAHAAARPKIGLPWRETLFRMLCLDGFGLKETHTNSTLSHGARFRRSDPDRQNPGDPQGEEIQAEKNEQADIGAPLVLNKTSDQIGGDISSHHEQQVPQYQDHAAPPGSESLRALIAGLACRGDMERNAEQNSRQCGYSALGLFASATVLPPLSLRLVVCSINICI